MALASTTVKVSYDGDGATVAFPTTFIFWDNTDIEAILRDATGTETTWVHGTQYTLSGGDGSTGTLTVNTTPTDYTPAVGEKLVIRSARANTQPTVFPLGGPFPSTNAERLADQLCRLIQQRQEEIDRTVKLTVTSAFSDITIPDPSAATFLRWNAAGTALENVTLADLSTVPISAFGLTLIDDVGATDARATLEVTKGVATGNVLQANQAVTTVASATSTALAGTNKQSITGTIPITSFTGTAGVTYHCECASLLPLVHSVGLDILNWGLNVTLAPDSTFDVYMVTSNTCVVLNVQHNRDYKRINTANGYGSTNNAIRRLTNIVDNIGGSVTYADSAAGGASFTINATGLYSMSYSDQFNASSNLGISLNSNELTTSIQNITQSHIIAIATTPAANQVATCSANGIFIQAGGVIRPHTAGAASGTLTSGCLFTIGRVG